MGENVSPLGLSSFYVHAGNLTGGDGIGSTGGKPIGLTWI